MANHEDVSRLNNQLGNTRAIDQNLGGVNFKIILHPSVPDITEGKGHFSFEIKISDEQVLRGDINDKVCRIDVTTGEPIEDVKPIDELHIDSHFRQMYTTLTQTVRVQELTADQILKSNETFNAYQTAICVILNID